jgi:recombination associated protein RdgC
MTPQTLEKLKFLQSNRIFLGREFLTWLWYWLDARNHTIDLQKGGAFQLYINDKIVLSSASGPVREHAMKGGTPSSALEARQALRSGKLVTEATFLMKQGKQQWTWSMKSDDMIFRNVRLPSVVTDEADSYLATRLRHIETLKSIKSELFKTFTKQRFSKEFRSVQKDMTTWAADA